MQACHAVEESYEGQCLVVHLHPRCDLVGLAKIATWVRWFANLSHAAQGGQSSGKV